jgi:DNA-binding NarL/FixJ family response regulator
MEDTPHSIVVIDDDPDVRALVDMLFEVDERFDVLASVGEGRAGIDAALRLQPDAVVVDLELPDMNGMAVIADIRAAVAEARIVVFSAFADPLTLFDALRSGADGYLDKGSAWAELVPIVAELCAPSMSSS